MPARRSLAIGAAVALALAPAPAPDTYPNDGARVMLVGDSITGSPGCWRPDVWAALTDAGHAVNMVGIRTENECGDVTNAAGDPWDPDNTGIGGITTTRMWVKLAQDQVLAATDPDVIVQLLGTNDLAGGATAEEVLTQYSALLDLYREHDPAITVVVAAPPPMAEEWCGCGGERESLEAALPAWALGASTAESAVTVADLSTGFDPATDTYDGVHPNDAGDSKLADAWTPAISAALDARGTGVTPSADPSPSASAASPDEATPPSARSWIVLALVLVVAGAVTFAMTRPRKPQP